MARPQRKAKRSALYMDYDDGSDEEKVEDEEEKWGKETMKVAKFFEDDDEEEYAPMPASIKEKKRKIKVQEKSEIKRSLVTISLVNPTSLLDANANNVTEDTMKEGQGDTMKEGQGDTMKEGQGSGTDSRTQHIPDPRLIVPSSPGDIGGNVGMSSLCFFKRALLRRLVTISLISSTVLIVIIHGVVKGNFRPFRLIFPLFASE